MPRNQPRPIEVKNKPDTPGGVELFIYDDIGPDWLGMVSAKGVARALATAGEYDTIYARVNSIGGDMREGVAIYNLLIRDKAKVIVDIDGSALSAASIIAMAGDEIRMAANAEMMIHNPWTITWGEASELRDTADVLDKAKQNLVETYTARTGLGAEEVSRMLDEETWFSADEAKAKGFATSVTPAKGVMNHADPEQIKARFKNAPDSFLARITPHQARSDDAAPEATEMITRPQFDEFASANPDAVTALSKPAVTAAENSARTAERTRCQELTKAFAAHPEFLNARIADGSSVADAKAKAFDEKIGAATPQAQTESEINNAAGQGTNSVSTDNKPEGDAAKVAPAMAQTIRGSSRWANTVSKN